MANFTDILNSFLQMQEQQKKENQERLEKQQNQFSDLMNAMTKMHKDEEEKEDSEKDEEKAESVTSDPDVNADHDEERKWAEEELKGEAKDEKQYDPASPAFEPKPTTSKMQPPPPPPPPSKEIKDLKIPKKPKENKKGNVADKVEEKRFKVDLDCSNEKEKRRAAKELMGEAKYDLSQEMKPYNEYSVKICQYYAERKCYFRDVTAHTSVREKGKPLMVYHHACEDCLAILGYPAGHPKGHRLCKLSGIYKERGEK